jgi:hypothetical protein
MSASILPVLRSLGPQVLKTLGPLFINKIHNLAVKELNRKVNSVTPRTNTASLQNQIRSVINSVQLSNNNKSKLKNLLVQLRNKAQQSLIK